MAKKKIKKKPVKKKKKRSKLADEKLPSLEHLPLEEALKKAMDVEWDPPDKSKQ